MNETERPPVTAPEDAGTTTRKHTRTAAIVGGVIALVAIAGIVILVIWAMGRNVGGSSDSVARTDAWSSAMEKAGVEAEYPGGPVDVTKVEPTGSHPFSATFTAEEISALLETYRYATRMPGQSVSLRRANVTFPSPGVAAISASMRVDDSSYSAKATAPATFENGRVQLSDDGAKASVEGFALSGNRLDQLLGVTETYINDFLGAAPGLQIESARIVEGGVEVTGSAPTRIEHPAPLE